ncbi:glycosyltransferase family 4 protein [Murdochiella sp. Marseille-P8839]|nr:glycosyltransferase family 4 protein [Murdochiella sp. Marseille-P8839]
MRIWIVNNYAIPPRFGGLVRHFYFSKYLRARGHDVRILTGSQVHNTTYNFVEPGQLLNEVTFDGVPYTYVRTMGYTKNNWRRVVNMVQFSSRCKKAMRKLMAEGERPDIIYASSPVPFSSKSAMSFAKRYDIPFVFEVRDLWPQSLVEYGNLNKKPYLKPMIAPLYALEHSLYRGADRLLFTMSGGPDYLRDRGWNDVDVTKCIQVNNGVDLAEFRRNQEKVRYNDLDLDDRSTFKVVYMGSIRMTYGLDVMLDVAKCCQTELPNVRFLFYGGGTELPHLNERIEQEHITNAQFKGRVKKEEIPSILLRADVTLAHNRATAITRYGTSNNKLFEYLAAGAPILSTVKTHGSLIAERNLGVETENQNVETIVSALAKLTRLTPEERETIRQREQALVQEYDYRALSLKMERIFASLLEEKGDR